MKNDLLLGLDQGTTSTRSYLINSNLKILANSQKTHQQIYPKPNWVEHNPLEIWKNTKEVLKQTTKKFKNKNIAALGMANQGETIMAWDPSSGQPLYPAIVWQDTRMEEQIQQLAKNKEISKTISYKTGLKLDSYFSASKIQWLLNNISKRKKICIGTLDSWLIWNLTQGEFFVTDVSTAARTLLFNIRTLQYDPWLLNLFKIPHEVLPKVLPTTSFFGTIKGLGKPLDGVPILANMVDQPAALYGQECLAEGHIKASYGTGCFIYLNTGSKIIQSRNGLLSTIAWQRGDKVTYALEGGIFAAASAVNWLIDELEVIHHPDKINSFLNSGFSKNPVFCVPSFAGLAAPYWNRNARAAWFGIGLNSTKADFIQAVIAGICHRVCQIIQAMKKESKTKMDLLKVDGGLTQSSKIMQIQANLLGIPIQCSTLTEATLLGVCALAGQEAKVWKSESEVFSKVKQGKIYQPGWTIQQRNENQKLFEKAISLVQEWS